MRFTPRTPARAHFTTEACVSAADVFKTHLCSRKHLKAAKRAGCEQDQEEQMRQLMWAHGVTPADLTAETHEERFTRTAKARTLSPVVKPQPERRARSAPGFRTTLTGPCRTRHVTSRRPSHPRLPHLPAQIAERSAAAAAGAGGGTKKKQKRAGQAWRAKQLSAQRKSKPGKRQRLAEKAKAAAATAS